MKIYSCNFEKLIKGMFIFIFFYFKKILFIIIIFKSILLREKIEIKKR